MNKRKIIIIMSMIIIGLMLIYIFLYRKDFMANPRAIVPESGLPATKFDVGFHWSTLLGMLGVLMFVTGLYITSKKNQQYKMGFLTLALNIITFCSWDFFINRAYWYYFFEFNDYDIMPKVYYSLCILEFFALATTVLIMIFCRYDNQLRKTYYLSSALSFLMGSICVFVKTITNQWFLWQTIVTIVILAIFLWGIQYGWKFRLKISKKMV